MKNLGPKILEDARFVKENLPSCQDKMVEIEAGTSGLDAEAVLSNLLLLTNDLLRVYEDPNLSRFFPHNADSEIQSPLSNVRTYLGAFIAGPSQHHANTLIPNADHLYAVCLRYGLVTFGLDQNVWKAIRQEITANKSGIQLAASEACADLKKTKESAMLADDAATRAVKAADESEANRGNAAASADDAATALREAREKAQRAEEELATAKAALETIQNSKAKSKEEMDEILRFHGEIEEHRGKMSAVKSEADAKYNELRDKHQTLTAEFKKSAEDAIGKNTALQAKIEELLQKAVGASLFGSFDNRRKGLFWGRLVWTVVMVLFVAAGVWLTVWISQSLSQGNTSLEPAFFVKLSAAIPITFGLIFSARQYSHERRAEEEYAFKSAISLSLSPYKDLLKNLKDDGYVDQAAFVEKLLLEVFDNPVARIYSGDRSNASKLEKAMTMKDVRNIVSVSKDLDIEKVRQLLELMGGTAGKPSP